MISQHVLDQVKAVSLLVVLEYMGYKPVKKSAGWWYYHSPLHPDNTPSFCVHEGTNNWKDHGNGAGGDVLKFAQLMEKGDFAKAVEMLALFTNADTTGPAARRMQVRSSESKILSLDLVDLSQAPRLEHYAAHDRGLDLALLRRNPRFQHQLKVAVYTRANKPEPFRSVAWKNDRGGLVLKSAGFTSVYGDACFTLIPAANGKKTESLVVFEGFWDYLSYLVLGDVPGIVDGDALVLNSLGLSKMALNPELKLIDRYQYIRLCFDNDPEGDKMTPVWQAACSHAKKVEDYRTEYAGFKDINDMLCGRRLDPNAKKKAAPVPKVKAAVPFAENPNPRWKLWIKWKVPQPDKDGVIHDSLKLKSRDDDYRSKNWLKAKLKEIVANGNVAKWILYERIDATGKDRIIDEWPRIDR